MTKAAFGVPLVVLWRALIASAMTAAAQMSRGLDLAGMRTTSTTLTVSALILVMPGEPSMMPQS